MENTKRASFSIDSYFFDKVFIDMSLSSGDDLFVDFQPSGIFKQIEKKYFLSFVFSAYSSDKKDTMPFVQIQCKGVFSFKDVDSLSEIPDFFYRNSIAILFPYMRAYVSMVTNQANIRPLLLPTLNLSALEKPLKENSKEE